MEFLRKFNQELVEAGEFVRTEGLGGPEQMKIVRATKSGAAITDGRLESKGCSRVIGRSTWRRRSVRTSPRARVSGARPRRQAVNMPIEVHPVMMSSTSGEI
jgi:hypothetical protein